MVFWECYVDVVGVWELEKWSVKWDRSLEGFNFLSWRWWRVGIDVCLSISGIFGFGGVCILFILNFFDVI